MNENIKTADIQPLINELDQAFNCLAEDASRLFHGRGQCFDTLNFVNVDWFSPVVWVVLYGDVSEEVVLRLASYLKSIAINNSLIETVLIQRRVSGKAQQDVVYGQLPNRCFAKESGMKFELNFSRNQNIGFFLDAQPGRQWLQERAAGKRVLNLFSYTCSFSVAAMEGGASHVVNIDMAKGALATGQKNHSFNNVDLTKVSFLPHDIFRSMRKLEQYGPYDLVVIDPPSRQKGSFEAEKDYGRLLSKLRPMLAEGAEILACLNAPYYDEKFLPEAFAANLDEFKQVERLAQRADFPEQDLGRCLKMQVFKA